MNVISPNKFHKVLNFDLGSLIREEELDGRQYIVVPMTMILEGVHTGSQGPVYYAIEELAKTPKMWNMKPIVIEHPFRGDTATDLEVYKRQGVGKIMNTHFIDGKLKAEAWIDKELAAQKCPELLNHIEHRLPMEISTGLFSELVQDEGVWNGEPYNGRIINIRADHLAILPRKQGACSLSDGAGLLINQSQCMPDRLNIITTVINQDYPAGSIVVADEGDGKENDKSQDAHLRTKTQEEPEEKKVTKPVEDKFQTQVFTTADGYRITVEPPANAALKIPDPIITSDETAAPKETIPETVPMQDNPTIVDSDELDSEGVEEFIESLRNLRHAAEKWRATQNAVLPEDVGKHGGRRFKETEDGWVQFGRPKGATKTEDTLEREARRKKIREELVALQIPLVQLKEELHDTFPGYKFLDLERVLEYDADQENWSEDQLATLERLLNQIEELEEAVSSKTDEYWEDFNKNGPTYLDPVMHPDDTPKRVADVARSGAQLELKEALERLDSEYAQFKAGKRPRKSAWFQFASDTTDADIEAMRQELQKEAAATEEGNELGEVFRAVQSVLLSLRKIDAMDETALAAERGIKEADARKVKRQRKAQCAAALAAMLEKHPFLKEFPELTHIVDSIL